MSGFLAVQSRYLAGGNALLLVYRAVNTVI